MNIFRKYFSLMMLMIVILQVSGNAVFNAKEITNELSEASSESEDVSTYTESEEITSEATNDSKYVDVDQQWLDLTGFTPITDDANDFVKYESSEDLEAVFDLGGMQDAKLDSETVEVVNAPTGTYTSGAYANGNYVHYDFDCGRSASNCNGIEVLYPDAYNYRGQKVDLDITISNVVINPDYSDTIYIKLGMVEADRGFDPKSGPSPTTTGYRTLINTNGIQDFDVTVRLYKKGTKEPIIVPFATYIGGIDKGQWLSMTTTNENDVHIAHNSKYFLYNKETVPGGIESSFFLREKTASDPAADELIQQAVGYYSYTDTLVWHYGRANSGAARELVPIYRMADNVEVEKTLVDDTNHNGIGETGEDLTYQLDITNYSPFPASNVEVRDALIEAIDDYSYLDWDGTFELTPAGSVTYTGDFGSGTLKIDQMDPESTISMTYTIHVNEIPDDVGLVENVVTITGDDPSGYICEEDNQFCSQVDVVLDPDTVVTKSVVDSNENMILEDGETLHYTISVSNPNTIVSATNVSVRDSLLENMDKYPFLTWVDADADTFGDITITDSTGNPVSFTGDLADGSLILNEVKAGETVTIEYDIEVTDTLPKDVLNVLNIATDDGSDPSIIDPEICLTSEDCSSTVTPLDGATVIEKSMADEDGDGVIRGGETVTYSLSITNDTENPAYNVVVRDSMLEDVPTWLTYNDDMTIDPTDTVYSGDLTLGDFTLDTVEAGQTITITYSLTADRPLPSDITEVANIATDNGQDPTIVDPEVCPTSEDCSEVITEVDPDLPIIDPTQAETVIEKSMTDEDGDGVIRGGETITYNLVVSNNQAVDAHDVVVRDSMLENVPTWLTYNDDMTIDPTDTVYSGDLTLGDFTLATVEAGQTITITYSLTAVRPLPSDITEVANIATDDGTDPITIDPETCNGLEIGFITIGGSDDCSEVITEVDPDLPIIDPIEGETVISKSVMDNSGDNLVQGGEVLTYSIEITNPSTSSAHNVVVRDSMLESMPAGLTLTGDVTIDPSDIAYTGSLQTGDLTFNTIEPGQTVTITYSVTAPQPLPTDITEIANVATDDGSNPVDPDTGLPVVCPVDSTDCSETVTPLDPNEPIIDPGEAETVISKSMTDSSGDNLVQGGEELTYSIEITNPSTSSAHNVVVRDSMLESMPAGLTLTGDVTIDPSDIAYTGSLQTGDLTFNTIEPGQTVTITYSVTAPQPLPTDITEIANVATDDGSNPVDPDTGLPVVCPVDSTDCSETVTPLDPSEPIIDPGEAETVISKSMTDSSGDNLVQGGEELTYTIEVTNPSTNSAHNVVVRDSMLESMPAGLTLTGDVTIDPNDIAYTGSLQTGDLTFNTIEPGQTVTITYSVTAPQPLPTDITEIANVATDDGSNPVDPDTGLPVVCPVDSTDCSETVTPLDPSEPIIDPGEAETVISKSMTDSSGDNLVQAGEELNYTIEVTNPSTNSAHNVVVRDSMLESMPAGLTLTGDITIDPSDIAYTGSLQTGDLTFNTIEPGQTVTITYSVTAPQPLPTDITEIANVATDDGSNPVDPDTGLPVVCPVDSTDCSETVTPIDPDLPIIDPTQAGTVIKKSMTDEDGDGIIRGGETVTYSLAITNDTENPAHNVVVRDSMLEDVPTWLTYNDDMTIDPTDTVYSGDLTLGDLTIDTVEAGQTITITYSLTAARPLPTDVTAVTNIATDNGQDPTIVDPEVCPTSEDCSEVITEVDPDLPIIDPTQAETVIEKSMTDEDGDGVIRGGETITYNLVVSNNQAVDAHGVVVRDSMLENIPTWLTYNDDMTIDPTDTVYSGDLTLGDFTIDTVEAGQTITITYSLTAARPLPADLNDVANIATDNGQDPITVDPETCNGLEIGFITIGGSDDCSEVITEVDPDLPIIDPTEAGTVIEKSMTDEDGDGVIRGGETITYNLVVSNNQTMDAHDVVVRDSMLENVPTWLTYNDDMTIDPTDTVYSGDLTLGDFTLDTVEAGQTITITYSLTAARPLPADVTTVTNIATDNGQDPTIVDPEICQPGEDCSEVITEVDPDLPIIDPTQSETVIEKSMTDEDGDGVIRGGETITYNLVVSNNQAVDAHDVVVRDSMLENVPTWLTYNDDMTIAPTDTVYSGDLTLGDFTLDTVEAGQTITITYSLTAARPLPADVTTVTNIATDNGQDPTIVDPEVCQPGEDCSEVITEVDPDLPIIDPTQAETVIEKSMTDEDGDGVIRGGETITYNLVVSNNQAVDAHDVVVRDSMLENVPTWLTYNNDMTIDPTDTVYSGDLALGDFTIDTVEAGQTITITYSLTAARPLPTDVTTVTNIATDNGQDPTIVDPEICQPGEDCSEVITEVDPDLPIIDPTQAETVIEKSMTDEDGDGVIRGGETITYNLVVSNNQAVDAHDVVVRDSMLENVPTWLTYNNDMTIDPTDTVYSGDLTLGDFTLDTVEAGQTITITYSLTAARPLPADVTTVTNIATDNGQDPTIVDPEVCQPGEDCSEVITEVDPDLPIIDPTQAETVIEKSMTDEDGDGVIRGGETITYNLVVSNNQAVDAHDVVVRDSMLENVPTWLTYNDDMTIDPTDTVYSGDLTLGDFTLDTVEAGQTITITYTLTAVRPLPADVTTVTNIATDNGQDPTIVDPEVCQPGEDCSEVITEVDPDLPIIDPTQAETLIEKSVIDEDGDGLVSPGEELSYVITLTNDQDMDIYNVPVRDSLLENLPEYLSWDHTVTVTGSSYTGSVEDGTMIIDTVKANEVVTIEYQLTMADVIPNDIGSVLNLATDTGELVETCSAEFVQVDCDWPEILVNPDTTIEKNVINESIKVDSIIEANEVITYQLTVTNPNKIAAATNVVVRDSLLETINNYDYLSWDGNVVVNPTDISYQGNLGDGSFMINQIPANQSVTIEYNITVGDVIPTDAAQVANVATDNGQDPTTVDPETCQPDEDCGEVTLPINPQTTIEKAITNESIANDGIAQTGEDLTYQVTVTNPSQEYSATNVAVRDSLLEALPSYLTWDGDLTVNPQTVETSGNLSKGTFVIEEIAPASSVSIEYVLHVNTIPNDVEELTNIVTDNGQDPVTFCTEDAASTDCSQVTEKVAAQTTVDKIVNDQQDSYSVGDSIQYSLVISNDNAVSALDVAVRDSLLESTPSYLQFNDDLTVAGSEYYGDIKLGTFVLTEVPANSAVTISYSMKLISQPGTSQVTNIVTDDGSAPKSKQQDENTDYAEIKIDEASIAVTGVGSQIQILIVLILIALTSLILRIRIKGLDANYTV